MKATFQIPQPEEVKAYALSIGFRLDVEQFCDYYAARGWKYPGNIPMKDWKCEVRSWRRRCKDAGALFDPVADKYRAAMAGKGTQQIQLDECVQQLQSIRSWRGQPNCPFGDPVEQERRYLSTTLDKHGAQFVAALLERAK